MVKRADQPTAVLVYLSGSRRGESVALWDDEVRIGTDASMDLTLPPDTEPIPAPHHVTLRRRGGSFELSSEPGRAVWVNGEPVDRIVLASGDVIEVGRDGAVLRFRIYPPGAAPRPSVAEVFSDCVECARHGAQTAVSRAGMLLAGLPRDLATRTSWLFRAVVVLTLIALGTATWALSRRSASLETRLDEVTRLAGLEELVDRSAREAGVTPSELSTMLAELEAGLDSASARLQEIQGRLGAAARIVRTASAATVFLQGAYGFRDPDSGRPMRLVVGPGGRPMGRAGGEPLLSSEGDGPVLEIPYTGTGFLATREGLILTNGHVAEPWRFDDTARRALRRGLRPTMHRFIGYLPGSPEPFEVSLAATSEEADVAVLRAAASPAEGPFLELGERSPEPGEEVIVLGYPLGIRALVARSGPRFIEELRQDGGADFWDVARRLAEEGFVAPLATRGIVGQRTREFLVYDAETTSGGSGGPVLDSSGRVVAINAAILPEFGGSNLGVPVARGRALLERVRESARVDP